MNTSKLKKEEEKRQLLLVKQRLEGLISSTISSKVKLKQGKDWAYNTKTKTIEYPIDGEIGVKNCPAEVFIGTLLHEVGHAKYSTGVDNVTNSIPDPKREYSFLLNAFEDIRIERKLVSRFPGTFDNLQHIRAYIETDEMKDKLQKLPDHINLLVNTIRNEWGYPLLFSNDKVEDFFYDNIMTIHEATSQKSSIKLHEYLKKNLWPKYKMLIEEPPPQQDPPPQDSPSDQPQDDSQDASQDDSKDGQGNTSPDISSAMSLDDVLDSLSDSLSSPTKSNAGSSLVDTIKKEPEKIEDTQDLAKPDRELLDNFSNGISGSSDYKTYEELYAAVQKYKGFFAKKLNSVLVDNNLKRFGGAFKSGNLNTKLLYKWKCNSSRVFSRPILRHHKEYSVCLLIDESCSMHGQEQHIEATKASVLMAEVLNAIGIPFEICGFNTNTRIYKKYDEAYTWAVKRNLELIIPQTHLWNAYNTNDAFAIAWANHRLKNRRGEKIMLVMSDGDTNAPAITIEPKERVFLPASANRYDDLELRVEIKKAETTSKVIGVGLNYSGVRESYTNNIVCDNISQLPKQLLSLLQKQIKRG